MGLFSTKDKEAEAHEDPPPYDEVDDVPLYEAPQFSNAADGSTRLAAATKYPPVLIMNFSWKHANTGWLGVNDTDRDSFTVATPKLIGKRTITLHQGGTDKGTVLASAETKKGSKLRDSLVIITPRQGRAQPLEFVMQNDHGWSHPWSMPVGNEGQVESFEWRNSRGKEIKSVSSGRGTYGWKLVRLSSPPGTGVGGKRHERDVGTTSDGKEVVAIGAHTNKWKSGPKFAFLGTGLTGTFGEDWESAAIITFLRLWELERQQNAAASSSAGASAGAAAATAG